MAKHVDILVGTVLGTAEYLADEIAAKLDENNIPNTIHLEPNLNEISINHHWVISCSTHGAGDLPDNIQPFFDQLSTTDLDLSQTQFAVVALGDSSYDTYCGAGRKLRESLLDRGASEICEIRELDAMDEDLPEEQAQEWINNLAKAIL